MLSKKLASKSRKAIVLLSGGLDSAVTLYSAKAQGFNCYCLIFDYAQRHIKEIEAAKKIARYSASDYRVLKISFPWKGSSLLDKTRKIRGHRGRVIPDTYVPGRNIIFLSFALSFAESISADAIFIGAHAQDYSGYPDCRPDFFNAFKKVVCSGTRVGLSGRPIQIKTPLINKSKADIIKLGIRLKAPLGLSWSCYNGGRRPCGVCDSCFYRRKGFKEAGIKEL